MSHRVSHRIPACPLCGARMTMIVNEECADDIEHYHWRCTHNVAPFPDCAGIVQHDRDLFLSTALCAEDLSLTLAGASDAARSRFHDLAVALQTAQSALEADMPLRVYLSQAEHEAMDAARTALARLESIYDNAERHHSRFRQMREAGEAFRAANREDPVAAAHAFLGDRGRAHACRRARFLHDYVVRYSHADTDLADLASRYLDALSEDIWSELVERTGHVLSATEYNTHPELLSWYWTHWRSVDRRGRTLDRVQGKPSDTTDFHTFLESL